VAPVEIVEVEARKPGKAAEAEAILARANGAQLIACDERGGAMTSRDFAARLAALRDDGVRHLALVIGGADGLDAAVTNAAIQTLSFGPQTWPHALARVMLAEQVYRAVTILAGSPYHRD
jgi:23S rRNA (pseudouridine1915-N3)-methyltransferase